MTADARSEDRRCSPSRCSPSSAPAALAHDGGEGLWGETNDKVITNAGFILIAFFPLFVLFASLLQWRLDKRKDAQGRQGARCASDAAAGSARGPDRAAAGCAQRREGLCRPTS